MNTARYYFLIFASLGLVCLKCSHTVYHYNPDRESPRLIFVDDQVQQAWSEFGKMPDTTFVEVTTREGDRERGLLQSVGNQTMTINTGYILSAKGGASGKQSQIKKIPQQQIIILKLW